MSFSAELKIENHTYRVLSCSHSFRKDIDQTGRVSSRARFGRIDLQIESVDNIFLMDGADKNSPLSGTVIFKKRDEEVKMKEYKFEDAYIIEHSERFQSFGDSPMTIDLSLSAHTLTIETTSEAVTISNEWRVI
ncbi:MAG: type VI secretion system needle protein Hcp [Flavobacteriales bacterium]|nr:type VI secretion system needle protein Hcp [Flavobacteriales bacterium]